VWPLPPHCSPHVSVYFVHSVTVFKTGSHSVAQAGLYLLGSGHPPASVSPGSWTTGAAALSQFSGFFCFCLFCYLVVLGLNSGLTLTRQALLQPSLAAFSVDFACHLSFLP
jgi:hypothetical protein